MWKLSMVRAFTLNKLSTIEFFVKKGVKIPPVINPAKWLIGLAKGLKKVNNSNISIMIEKIAISFECEGRYRLYNKNSWAPSNPKIPPDAPV